MNKLVKRRSNGWLWLWVMITYSNKLIIKFWFDVDNNEELCFFLCQVSWIRLADLKLLTVGNVYCTMLEYISPVQRMSLEAVVNFDPPSETSALLTLTKELEDIQHSSYHSTDCSNQFWLYSYQQINNYEFLMVCSLLFVLRTVHLHYRSEIRGNPPEILPRLETCSQ